MSISTFGWIAIFAVSSAIVNSIGIASIYYKKKWTDVTKTYLMCFAAGVLISVPLMYTLPKASRMNSNAGIAALIGFLFMHFSNVFIKKATKRSNLAFGITALEGIGIHSFIDGAIYTITFSASIFAGLLASIGLVVHEFAEGVITYSVLMESNISKKRAFYISLLVSSLTTPIGAFIAYPLIHKFSVSSLGLALGFVSGVLVYLSASHLLPEARLSKKYEDKHSLLSFIIGVTVALFIVVSQI